MDETQPQFLDVGSGPDRRRIAYLRQPSRHAEKPSLVFLSGFKSEMRAIKAGAVSKWAQERGHWLPALRLFGPRPVRGRFEDGTVSRWLEETHAVFRQLTQGPQVLIGSSMGGYIALLLLRELLAEAPEEARRIKGLVLIAPAWNMTELMWENLPTSARREIEEKGVYLRPSRYEDGPYPITRQADRGRPAPSHRQRAVRSRAARAYPARPAGSRRALGAHAGPGGAPLGRLDAGGGGA